MKIGLLLSAAALTLAPLPVLAHGGHGFGQALQAELPALFTQADANGDGSLTLDEFKTFRELVAQKRRELQFQRLDANGDGKVTLDEIKARAAERRAGHCSHEGEASGH
jgi:EF-hand domain pair